MKRKSTLLAAAALFVSVFVANSSAAPITFTFTGEGAGSLDGNVFGSSAFTITGLGDTDDRQSFSGGYFIHHTSASINIANLGTFNFSTATRTFFNDNNDVTGFSRSSGADLFNGLLGALDGWDMMSSIGPVGGEFGLLQWNNSDVLTDGGKLLFDSAVNRGTFAAVVHSSVPDASSTVLLLGSGLLGLSMLRRRFAS